MYLSKYIWYKFVIHIVYYCTKDFFSGRNHAISYWFELYKCDYLSDPPRLLTSRTNIIQHVIWEKVKERNFPHNEILHYDRDAIRSGCEEVYDDDGNAYDKHKEKSWYNLFRWIIAEGYEMSMLKKKTEFWKVQGAKEVGIVKQGKENNTRCAFQLFLAIAILQRNFYVFFLR